MKEAQEKRGNRILVLLQYTLRFLKCLLTALAILWTESMLLWAVFLTGSGYYGAPGAPTKPEFQIIIWLFFLYPSLAVNFLFRLLLKFVFRLRWSWTVTPVFCAILLLPAMLKGLEARVAVSMVALEILAMPGILLWDLFWLKKSGTCKKDVFPAKESGAEFAKKA